MGLDSGKREVYTIPGSARMQSPAIHISISRQRLELRQPRAPAVLSGFHLAIRRWARSRGASRPRWGGSRSREKIGDGRAARAPFSRAGCRPGELGDPADPADLVQTRILWLHGLEPENANTRERYIYIHGTNHEAEIGTPASHGCIRMRNADVAELFDMVAEGTPVHHTAVTRRVRDSSQTVHPTQLRCSV